ncbi:MAG: methyl-accepting chemotaxis protein [Desulfococcaceae bacterium]
MKRRYLIPTVALIAAGMVISVAVSYVMISRAIEDGIHVQLTHIADATAKSIAEWVDDRKMDIKGWSQFRLYEISLKDTHVGRNARISASQDLKILLKNYPAFENICIADPGGDLVAAGDESIIGKIKVSDRKYFQESMSGKLYISDPFGSRVTGNPVFAVSAPIRYGDDVTGVFFCIIRLDFISTRFIQSVHPGKSAYAFLYDREGNIIAHPDHSAINRNIKDFSFGSAPVNQKQGHFAYKDAKTGGGTLAISPCGESGWTVGVAAPNSEIMAPVRHVRNVNILLSVIVISVAVLLILRLVNATVKPLSVIAEGLICAGELVSGASQEITHASQSLSENSSHQAASVEQSSASLEEMAAMTKRNAENAAQADRLMKAAAAVIKKADEAVKQLTVSMTEVSTASEETSRIVKTIDGIAFQTNLLALNAAVEAARAGEAGAGFAVVAAEVRNLAMSSAEAAKNTSVLIESTVNKIRSGAEFVSTVSQAFGEVASSAGKVGELLSEIAQASNEQAEGISQISKSVSVMDKVTQQNAADAQMTHSSAEEMYSQARELNRYVAQLQHLISGTDRDFAGFQKESQKSF